ncbi:MAG: PKD domain-containing protein [Holophaga sp.]|nr:PKD domain-containing protein [Holophaga sp.]
MIRFRIPPTLLAGVAAAAMALQAGTAASVSAPAIDETRRVTLASSQHPVLARLTPTGAVDPDQPMGEMILSLKMDADAKTRLKQLLAQQQDRTSASYHKWITPEGFRQQFGPSQASLDAATAWLTSQGFTVNRTARSGMSIVFSGTASQVGVAFRTAMMEYKVNGSLHHGNATAISMPAGLAEIAHGVVSLNDMRRKSHLGPRTSLASYRAAHPQVADGNYGNDVGPGDFAKIYNLDPLFAAGNTGTGVTVAVVGRTDIRTSDWTTFRNDFSSYVTSDAGAGSNVFTGSLSLVYPGADPGTTNEDDEFESDVDTQWAAGTAPGATIKLVVGYSSYTTDGTDLSAQYIVDNQLASIMTESYGECESDLGTSGNAFFENLWSQAAAEGISVFVAAGDSGAAGCSGGSDTTGSGRAVSGIASTPYNTAVGGTMLDVNDYDNTTYWSQSSYSFQTSAKQYVPEWAWNESSASSEISDGSGLWAGGGGNSTLYPAPTYQKLVNTFSGTFREIPDVSFTSAGGNNPLIVVWHGDAYLSGGTSFASPCMAGITALMVQKYGSQGNINPVLYTLAHEQYDLSTVSGIFHDVTVGNNTVSGAVGYNAAAGYDEATGLGSLNAYLLWNHWPTLANPVTVTVTPPGTTTVTSGTVLSFYGTGTTTAGAALTYVWEWGDGTKTSTSNAATVTHTYTNAGTSSKQYDATLVVSDGTYANAQSVTITVTPVVSAAITMPVTNVGVYPGVSVTFTGSGTTSDTGATLTYAWDFGDGSTATGASVTHAFADHASSYRTVTLTVTDSSHASGTASIQVYSDTSVLDIDDGASVDVRDLLVLMGTWSTTRATVSNFEGLDLNADLNADGYVNDTDVDLWITGFEALESMQ